MDFCFVRPSAVKALEHKWLKEQLGEDDRMLQQPISHRSVRTGAFATYLAMKKLKKAALGYIATNLTQEEVGTLEEIFNSLDTNKNGHITLQELDKAITQGKFSDHVLQDLRELRSDLAISGDQQLNYRDFVASTMDRSIALRDENVKKAFHHFSEKPNAEFLTIDDLSDIFGGNAQALEVMMVLDTDRDGKVYFEDFKHALLESLDEDDCEPEDSSNGENIS
jgi:calcium-dependent protein kinase